MKRYRSAVLAHVLAVAWLLSPAASESFAAPVIPDTLAPSATASAPGDTEPGSEVRTLSIYNIHTKETSTVTFKKDGAFIPEGLVKLNQAMRDWRRNEPTKMDPKLIDLIWEIHRELGSKEPVHLISGYRSRRTNNGLRKRVGGQARNSRHILGKAADIHFPDVPAKRIRNSALVRQRGGVGYYPKSGVPFVHVDTGRVRHWPRVRRRELAMLFPSGRSKHVPSDGRPLTKKDGRIARARLAQLAKKRERAKGKHRKAPAVVLAGFTPPTLPFGIGASADRKAATVPPIPAAADVTASITEQRPERSGIDRLASLDLSALAPGGTARKGDKAAFAPAAVLRAPEFDDEHPDDLSYRPFSVLPLMTDASVADSTRLAGLVHPNHEKIDYYLAAPEPDAGLQFARQQGHERLSSARRFSGEAIRGVVAAEPAGPGLPVPNRKPRRRLRTASRF